MLVKITKRIPDGEFWRFRKIKTIESMGLDVTPHAQSLVIGLSDGCEFVSIGDTFELMSVTAKRDLETGVVTETRGEGFARIEIKAVEDLRMALSVILGVWDNE